MVPLSHCFFFFLKKKKKKCKTCVDNEDWPSRQPVVIHEQEIANYYPHCIVYIFLYIVEIVYIFLYIVEIKKNNWCKILNIMEWGYSNFSWNKISRIPTPEIMGLRFHLDLFFYLSYLSIWQNISHQTLGMVGCSAVSLKGLDELYLLSSIDILINRWMQVL